MVLGKRGTDSERTAMMHIVRLTGVVIGITIVWFLIRQVGWDQIKQSLGMLKWSYAIVISYPITWILLNTQGWRLALHKPYARVLPLLKLAEVRTAGETFNSLLPSGYVGGEPLKAHLLSRWIPLSEAASSVLIAKAAQSVGLVLFIGLGLTIGGKKGSPNPLTRPGEAIALALLTLGIVLFVVLLARSSFARLGQRIHRLTGHPFLHKLEPHLIALDQSIGAFYREGKMRFLLSVGWHSLGWIAGAIEVAIIFALVGHSVSWREAWFVGALAQLGSVVGLFAPMGIGLYEGGHYLAASALGIPPALGVSVALIRRVRELFWNIVGLVIFWRTSKIKEGAVNTSLNNNSF